MSHSVKPNNIQVKNKKTREKYWIVWALNVQLTKGRKSPKHDLAIKYVQEMDFSNIAIKQILQDFP